MQSSLFSIDCGDIVLQEFRLEDVDAIVEITSQPEVYRFLPDWRTTRERRLFYLTEYELPSNQAFLAAAPDIGGLGPHLGTLKLGIIHKETGAFIGFICSGLKEELPEPNREVAYAISKHYWSRGYATKAVRGLTGYLFEHTDLELLNAIALLENSGSNKVIQKSGFTCIGDIAFDGQAYHHYILRKSDWLSGSVGGMEKR